MNISGAGVFSAAAAFAARFSCSCGTGFPRVILFVLFTRRVLMSRHLVGWAFLGFVALGIVFTEQVWRSYFDITRAVAPIITSFVLLVFLGAHGSATIDDRESIRTA